MLAFSIIIGQMNMFQNVMFWPLPLVPEIPKPVPDHHFLSISCASVSTTAVT
jgi:hypothetical protein